MSSTIEGAYIEWHPIRQLLGSTGHEFALIILNQPLRDEPLLRDLWSVAKQRFAADGGANRVWDIIQNSTAEGKSVAEHYDNLDVIIGDLDSLSDAARHHFESHSPPTRVVHDPDQYSTDFTKAVRLVRRESPGLDIICMGGLGGRVDQGLSQLHHLYMFQTSPTYAEGKMYLLSGESLTFLLKSGKHRIHVREPAAHQTEKYRFTGEPFDKYVGIIPVKNSSVITTRGLEWDVQDWPTELGGQLSTSNHILPETKVVDVETTSEVLFTVALK
ncbi:thiamine pyrophosphokinase [Xylariaceae sp. FL0016]|nr:thiamine pyrophosphokinase [Xylariaceae sp. FL0016]